MKILTLHCDYIKFKAVKKALKKMESLPEKDLGEKEVKDALVVLNAVEKGDTKSSVKELVFNIKDIAKQVHARKIVLYPYAHLSSNLASPEIAMGVLNEAEKQLKKHKFEVTKAPFGYYKKFEVKVKGHPLAELSREIKPQDREEEEKDFDVKNALRSIGKSVLDRSKLKSYDHRIIGQEMDLFSFNEVAPGSVFWHGNGLIIYNELVSFVRKLLKDFDYKEISTPQILDNKIWKVSGHWQHYRENMFLTNYESKDAAVRPMNCPGAMLVYKTTTRSYKEFPLRFAEIGVVHRKELSGVLAGLFRAVKFTQDDAHIFLEKEQLEKEMQDLFKFIKIIYEDTFNFDYSIELSTRPKKFLGDKKDWDYSEKVLEKSLKKAKIKYKINKGDGAFYGPKIDIHIKDSLNRDWQLGTIQLDMQMPTRFQLSYTGKDNKGHTPLVIHRAIFGSLERFIGILLEDTKGRFPTWLAPIQVKVLSFTDRNKKYAEKVVKEIQKEIHDVRVDSDFRKTTVPSKVKDAELMRVPYILVLGDKEQKSKSLAVRVKGNKKILKMKLNAFVKKLKKEIEDKK